MLRLRPCDSLKQRLNAGSNFLHLLCESLIVRTRDLLEGSNRPVFGCKQIRAKDEVFRTLGVAGNTSRIHEAAFSLALVRDAWALQDRLRLKLPCFDVVAHRDAGEALEGRIVAVAVVSAPTPYADAGVEHVKVCRQVEPEVAVGNVVSRGRMAVAVDL